MAEEDSLGWWMISGEEFMEALRRANAGESPDVLYVEFYVNSEVEVSPSALNEEERAILVQTLIYHYRKDSQYCGCGWGKLGYSHAEHVVDVFEESVIRARE